MKEKLPWSLSPRQAFIIDCYIVYGRSDLVATRIGIKIKTLDKHMERAREKMKLRGAISGKGNMWVQIITAWWKYWHNVP